MIKSVDTGEISYINYVVKDTRYGMYGVFVEYIPEILIQHQGDQLPDVQGFSGEIRIYNQYGIYTGSNNFENGNKINSDYRYPCGNDENNTGGGGGGISGEGPGPGGPTTGDGSGGTGGENLDIIITCDDPALQEISCPPGCDCTACFVINFVCDIEIKAPDDYYNKTGRRDPLREPCSDDNTQDPPCRCPSDVEDGQTDVDPQDENDDIPILLDLFEITELNEYIEPNLTIDDIITISELGIHSELLNYLVSNVDPDDPVTFEEGLLIARLNSFLNPNLNQDQIEEIFESEENIAFAEYALQILIANPASNPLLGADCSSFEYAQPPGVLQKGCAVTDFNHTFYAAGIRANGSPYYGEIDSNIPIIYFTMPTFLTNGQAANLTAEAVTNAIRVTDIYFLKIQMHQNLT